MKTLDHPATGSNRLILNRDANGVTTRVPRRRVPVVGASTDRWVDRTDSQLPGAGPAFASGGFDERGDEPRYAQDPESHAMPDSVRAEYEARIRELLMQNLTLASAVWQLGADDEARKQFVAGVKAKMPHACIDWTRRTGGTVDADGDAREGRADVGVTVSDPDSGFRDSAFGPTWPAAGLALSNKWEAYRRKCAAVVAWADGASPAAAGAGEAVGV